MSVLSRFRRTRQTSRPPTMPLLDQCAVLVCGRRHTRVVKGVRLCDRCGPFTPAAPNPLASTR